MSVRRALASRSVHLRIVPRPANLSESREIFRVLQQFGEISTFKSLRYEYQNPADNVALAIFRSDQAAQAALDASPIRFALEKTAAAGDDVSADNELSPEDDEAALQQLSSTPSQSGIEQILRPSSLLTRSSSSSHPNTTPLPQSKQTTEPPPMPFDPPSPEKPQMRRQKPFQITIDRSRVIHADFIERQPFWKQFHPTKSMAQIDLAKSVPHPGLSDVSKRPPNAHRTPVWVLKGMSDYVEKRMPTLRAMWEDGENERGYRQRKGLSSRGYGP